MAIEVSCPSCAGHFRVPDSAAGKKIRCPKCKGAMDVPAAEAEAKEPEPEPAPEFVPPPISKPASRPQPAPAAAAVASPPPALAPPAPTPVVKSPPPVPPAPAAPTADEWFLQTPEGDEYGPVPRSELDDWFREGRITVECQLLKSGQEQWQWAAEIYKQLDEPPVAGRESGGQKETRDRRQETGKEPAASTAKSKTSAPKQPLPPADDVERSQRSRMVAGFLGIFLGPLGIHRFYLGYWGIGLAMLFTGGGLFFWGFFDAIFVMLGRIPDADGRPLSD